MNLLAHLIIGKWWIVVGLGLVVSAVAVAGLTSPSGNGQMGEIKSEYALKSELDGEFGSDGSECLIVVDVVGPAGDLFDGDRLSRIAGLVDRIEALGLVDDVLSLGDLKRINLLGLPVALLPRDGAGEEEMASSRTRVLEHPLGRQLISPDCQTLMLPVLFTQASMEASYIPKFLAVERALEQFDGGGDLRVRLTGLYPLWEAERAAVERDRIKFIVIGYVLTALLAIYLFRSLWVTAAIGLPAFIGVFWTVGILTFLNEQPTPLTQVVMPMMLTMVGFTDAVHLMFHIRRARWAGASRADAARSAVSELGIPCALTSFTTAVGFGSLMVAGSDVIRSFGLSCAIGVVVTFLAVVTLVPILSLTRLGKNVHLSHEHDFMEKHRGRVDRLLDRMLLRARWIVAAAGLLMVIFAGAASTLRPDNRFLTRMPDRSEAYLAMAHVDEHLGGTQVLRVSLEWDEGALDEAALVEKLGEVETILIREPLLAPPLSLRTILEALPGKGDELAARMGKLRFVPSNVVGGVYQPNSRRALVSVRVRDLGIAVYKPVFERIDLALAGMGGAGLRIEMTGDPIVWGRYLDRMVMDLLKSLGLASAIILVVMGLVYRSVRTGLIAIVPNLFPLAATGAMLALFRIPLVIETVCAFTICLGIAVDDTIHFLSRYRVELGRQGDGDMAIRESFIKVGSPLIVTTVLMVTGFATVLWSELPGFRMFGAMACATLAAAFVADLLILPALLKVFGHRRGE
ncbi:MAG: efflux RND transporter permease subunit [Verrucomicrobiales bacterium]